MTALPCATSPERTAMFVGDGPKDDRESNWDYARQLCQSCPVLDECRAMVLTDEANGVPHIGVAGGLLPSERKGAYREVKEHKRPGPAVSAKCGTTAAARRHERNGEELCGPCRIAASAAERKRAARRKVLATVPKDLIESAGLTVDEVAEMVGLSGQGRDRPRGATGQFKPRDPADIIQALNLATQQRSA